MFYCDSCAEKKNWDISCIQSFGPCGICGQISSCNHSSENFSGPQIGVFSDENESDSNES